MKAKRVTIKDIAKQAGVSIGTVDRVLHHRGEVADATKEKILSLAESMNYQPNIFARALISQKVYNIAVLLPSPSHNDMYWAKHLEGIKNTAHQLENYLFNVHVSHYDLHDGEDFVNKAKGVVESRPDGVIFAPILKKESLILCADLDKLSIPYIFIDTNIEGANCLGFIGEDAFQSGRVAASLIDYGLHPDKDILIVNIAKDLDNTQHLNMRNQGFISYFLDAGKNRGVKISLEIPSAEPSIVAEKLDSVFERNDNIGAIWVSGAKAYVIARHLDNINKRNLIVLGYEIYEENVAFMQKNVIQYLIAQHPVKQSRKALRKMFNYLISNIPPSRLEYQRIEIVNTENVRFYN
jgi:LacI family transcriptional regulator